MNYKLRRLYRILRLKGASRSYARRTLGIKSPSLRPSEIRFLLNAMRRPAAVAKRTAIDRRETPWLAFLCTAK